MTNPAISAAMRAHWADPEVRARRRRATDERGLQRWAVQLRAHGNSEEEIARLLERARPMKKEAE